MAAAVRVVRVEHASPDLAEEVVRVHLSKFGHDLPSKYERAWMSHRTFDFCSSPMHC